MRNQDPTLDQLFEATRAVERTPNPQRERLRGAVAQRLVAAGAMTGTAAVATKAAAGALGAAGKAGVLVAWKGKLVGILALATIGSMGTAVMLRARGMNPLHANDGPGAASSPAPMSVPAPAAAPSSAPVSPGIAETSGIDEPARSRIAPSSSRPERGNLADELALVRGAQSALTTGQPRRALSLLDTYFHRFPRGVLVPEAKASQIKALCLAGDADQANRQAERFSAAHPDSPLAAGGRLRCTRP
jgi:hypothetical protein